MVRLPHLKRSLWVFILIGLLYFFLYTNSAFAQNFMFSDDDVNQVARQLYCPVCENVPLDVCPLDVCVQWREVIRQQLAEGRTEQEIKNYFVSQYGDRVLGEPPRQGLNWLLYVLPPGAVLLGLVLLVIKFKRSPKQAIDQVEKQYLDQVERDLKFLDKQ